MAMTRMGMATPFKEEVYVLPSSEQTEENENTFLKKIYISLKAAQLFFAVAGIALFTLGVSATQSTIKDMLISASFGMFVIYPVIFISLSLQIRSVRNHMVIFNVLAAAGSLAIGGLIINSWWDFENVADVVDSPILFEEIQDSATLKFVSSLTCFINGILCICETVLMELEYKKYL